MSVLSFDEIYMLCFTEVLLFQEIPPPKDESLIAVSTERMKKDV